MGYFSVASIVLISKSGLLIFQRRDDKPDIRNPGMISAWGGAVEDEQVINFVYLLRGVDESNLKVYEGQGYELIRPGNAEPNAKYTELTVKLIADLA